MGDDSTGVGRGRDESEGSSANPRPGSPFVDRRGERWRVRAFEPADREPLLATYRDFDPDERAMGLPPVDETRLEDWLDYLLEAGWNVVARRDGEVVGHAAYTPVDDPEPELAVFVHQSHQGRGLGTELCRHVLAAASEADCDALVLDVKPANRTAVGIYERLGFERVDHGADGPGRQGHAVRMRRSLPPTATEQGQQSRALGD